MKGLWKHTKRKLLPSSNLYDEAVRRVADCEMEVQYGGGVVHIKPGDHYFTDSAGRVLVGWHGTYDPPSGMDSEPTINQNS